MMRSKLTQSFPLPEILQPSLRDLMYAFAHQAKVPAATALAVVLNATAAAVQRVFAVKLPQGGLEPAHRLDLVVAAPESGKDTLFREVFAALLEHDRAIESLRISHGGKQARACLIRTNKVADAIEVIVGRGQSTVIVQTDGSEMLSSSFFKRKMALTCDLWNGQTTVTERNGAAKLCTAVDPAVSMLVMLQAAPLARYIANYGERAFEVGLLQRCNITFESPPSPVEPLDPCCIAEFQLDLRDYLGDPLDVVLGVATPVRGIPLSPAAAERYLALLQQQEQARMAGEPGPWRWLQKAVRTSLLMHLVLPHRQGDKRLQREEVPRTRNEFIELETFEAACAYQTWLHQQDRMQQLMTTVSAPLLPSGAVRPLPPRKLSQAERRRLETIEDADELMRKLEEYLERHPHVDVVPVRELKKRVGLYPDRFFKALAYLEDGGHILEVKRMLRRLPTRYHYGSAFPFATASGFGGV